MDFLINLRNDFFEMTGKSRFKRIVVTTFFIALVWMGVDFFVYDNVGINFKHDLISLALGIAAERLIPWGKTSPTVA